ncbi:MAG: SEC-C metal-binding domain-containing protein [Lysobacteraceae bacterium]
MSVSKGPNVRLLGELKAEAAAYADGLGISLNAFVAVAVREYLDARRSVFRVAHPPSLPAAPVEERRASAPAPETAQPAGSVKQSSGHPQGVPPNDPCPCRSGRKAKNCSSGHPLAFWVRRV